MSPDSTTNTPRPVQLTEDGRLFRPVCILGAWGSGTSALTMVFEGLGYYSCPPHYLTNDPRTPSSYEPELLRAVMLNFFNQPELERFPDDSEPVTRNLRIWYEQEEANCNMLWKRGVVMKLPLLCFYVPELHRALNPHFIVVTRDIDKIEQTRQRRDWDISLGRMGAEACLEAMTRDLAALQLPHFTLRFEDLQAEPREQMKQIGHFLGEDYTEQELDKGCSALFVK